MIAFHLPPIGQTRSIGTPFLVHGSTVQSVAQQSAFHDFHLPRSFPQPAFQFIIRLQYRITRLHADMLFQTSVAPVTFRKDDSRSMKRALNCVIHSLRRYCRPAKPLAFCNVRHGNVSCHITKRHDTGRSVASHSWHCTLCLSRDKVNRDSMNDWILGLW